MIMARLIKLPVILYKTKKHTQPDNNYAKSVELNTYDYIDYIELMCSYNL